MVSSWVACRKPIPKQWEGATNPMYETHQICQLWELTLFRNAMVYSEAQTLGAGKRFDLVSQARKTMLRLKSLSDTVSALASAVRAESRAARANFDAVKNMCGLASLPNELLRPHLRVRCQWGPGPQKIHCGGRQPPLFHMSVDIFGILHYPVRKFGEALVGAVRQSSRSCPGVEMFLWTWN